ncbi:MAG TPA: haloacid dehalogenase [Planctomycetaceae bacterium]|nr:haloacid dehalogenase [Planctomycetaceae bacterium]HCK54123.1 haloacid dehalogenase [Planctomycetaceae bacterium]
MSGPRFPASSSEGISSHSRPPAAIRCVAIDAVGTLIEADPPVVDAYVEIGRRHGSDLGRDQVARRLSEAFTICAETDMASGENGLRTSEKMERERWRWIVGEVFACLEDQVVVRRCFDELFEHFGRASAWRCYEDVEQTIAKIESRGLDMVIASNFDHRLHTVCLGWSPLQRARAVIVSSEVGWRKPGALFFDALVTACGCRADEVLMVGDDPVNDFQGALEAGLQAVLLDRGKNPGGVTDDAPGTGRPSEIAALDELEAWLS